MQNFHILEVSYHGPTNSRGSRVRIHSSRFKQTIFIPYDYEWDTINEMATAHLIAHGFNVTGQGEGMDCNYLISDTFQPLKK